MNKTHAFHSTLHLDLQGHATSTVHHQDTVALTVRNEELSKNSPEAVLSQLLQAFVDCPAKGVTRLMLLRNALVTPIGLRTSSLGCPVSSLLAEDAEYWFDDTFPVLRQFVSSSCAEVLLGADDKHLRFRTIVSVNKASENRLIFRMTTQVQCINWFGHLYLFMIEKAHRDYIAPTMLRQAVNILEKNQNFHLSSS